MVDLRKTQILVYLYNIMQVNRFDIFLKMCYSRLDDYHGIDIEIMK